MDIISHGLWGGAAFGRKRKADFWWSFFYGIAPDLFSFGVYLSGSWVGIFDHPSFASGRHPDDAAIPYFVHALYNVTHSLVIFVLIFGLAWFVQKKFYLPMAAWGLHILVDIPTHADKFFPTPFLWPFSDFHVNGHSWGTPEIFIPNVLALILIYYWYFLRPRYFSKEIKARE
jgi:hypothetical protein